MADTSFQCLFPATTASVDAARFVEGIGLDREIPAQRPLVLVNFVSTLDGNATFDGRSAPLSDAGDRALFHALRGASDAIMAGTGTLAIESYRPAVKPVVTVTRSGRLPTGIPLFSESDGRVIVFSGAPVDLEGVAAHVTVEPLSDLPTAMGVLRRAHGVEVLLCEGGPSLFGAMIRAGLVDELFLTLSPKLAGGSAGPSLTSGPPAAELAGMVLASVLEYQGTLCLRYRRPV